MATLLQQTSVLAPASSSLATQKPSRECICFFSSRSRTLRRRATENNGWILGAGLRPGTVSRRHSWGLHLRAAAVGLEGAEQGEEVEQGEEPQYEAQDLSDINEWQLDFCSRPILDERGKKVWELLVCDASKRLLWAEYFPNNKINSIVLKEAILRISEETGAPLPERIKFFRAQMQNIISKACVELEVKPIPSRRVLALQQWLQERFDTVYSKHPGFQEGAAPLLQLEPPLPESLPDALAGERWALVELPLYALLEEAADVDARKVYGSTLDLGLAGLDLKPDAIVPGLAVFTSRATAVAARMAALELASLEVDAQRGCMVLNVGVSERWRYASYRRNKQTDFEAQKWDEAKARVGGLHFVALQKNESAENVDGLWMLLDSKPLNF